MASEAERKVKIFLENQRFVERLIHDVLVYTLTKCGLPASSLPTTVCTENIYRHADFLKTAGASVLRISLIMRDSWKRMFKSRRNSGGFSKESIPKFISSLIKFSRTGRTHCIPSVLELLLALCNEMILYFHFEKIDIDFNVLTTLISDHIAVVTGMNRSYLENLEVLFDSLDDVSGYTEWITDFISRFAIPYGSRDDVSDLYFEHICKKFEEDIKKLTDSFRYLPHGPFSAITAAISENVAELVSIRRDGQSLEPPKSTTASEVRTLGKSKFLGSRSTGTENSSETLSENQSSKLEQRIADVGSKSLSPQKMPTDSEIGIKSENLATSTSIQSDIKSQESPKLLINSEIGNMEGKKSSSCQSTCTIDVLERFFQGKQSSEGSSELVIKQDFGKTCLDVQEISEFQDPKAQDKITKEKNTGKIKGILFLYSFIGFAFLAICFKIYTRKRRFK